MPLLSEKPVLEEGDPAQDARTFRRCLGQFATGIAIVTTRFEDKRAGVTVNSFSSVSLDPPLILWSISRQSRSFPVFEASDRFSVNVLASDQIELSRHFSSAAEDKFTGADWLVGKCGIPLLAGAVAHFECHREAAYDGGDHMILVGRVERFARYGGKPLLFAQGQYMVAENHPGLVSGQTAAPADSPQTAQENDLIALIFDARNSLSARFDQHRIAEGISSAEGRVLRRVYDSPGISLEMLVRTTFLGDRDLEDTISGLTERSLLRCENGEFTLTPAGRARREAIRKRWLEFQSEQISGMSNTEIQGALAVLKRLVEQNP